MSGYPDSHLNSGARGSGVGVRRLLLVAAPVIAVAVWVYYLWFISGVIPATDKFQSGRLKSEGFVQRAGGEGYLRQGHWVTYHENGQKESEGEYTRGAKTGEWMYWDSKGKRVADVPASRPSG